MHQLYLLIFCWKWKILPNVYATFNRYIDSVQCQDVAEWTCLDCVDTNSTILVEKRCSTWGEWVLFMSCSSHLIDNRQWNTPYLPTRISNEFLANGSWSGLSLRCFSGPSNIHVSRCLYQTHLALVSLCTPSSLLTLTITFLNKEQLEENKLN
jgi:hypothetical protein